MTNEEAEREFIVAFFDEFEDKVAFLSRLHADRHQHEANILCLVYIDGLANWLHHPHRGSAKNFCRALCEHGGTYPFDLVLPKWLLSELPWGSSPKGLEERLQGAVAGLPEGETYRPSEFLEVVRPATGSQRAEWLERELWRGSVAHAVYKTLRVPSVHSLMGDHGLSFSESTREGEPLGRIGLEVLHEALLSLTRYAREVSEETGNWFGIEPEDE